MLNEVVEALTLKKTPLLYEFDGFRVDVPERVLFRDGNPVPLAPKVFDTLLVLVENNGHVLEKLELMTAIWPESFVEEVNLAHNVSVLRKVLGESASGGKFIETIPKRGYRFTCEFKPLREERATNARRLSTSALPASVTNGESFHGTTANFIEQAAETQSGFSRKFILNPFAAFVFIGLLTATIGVGYYFFASKRTAIHAGESKPIESVAVLPFANESGDANLDYLSDGLSESVIDRLSQLQQLKVISRNSSFKYRGNNLDLQAVANGLDVQAIVVGRVAISGDNLIIRAELVDALENRQLWSESYNRRATDLQAIQGEIAQIVTRKLRLRLTGEQETQLAKREGVNSQAYESMLKGRFHFYKGGHSIESLNRAIKNFQEAIDLEPDYALAYAELSAIYRTLGANGYLDPKEMTPKAESAALKAVELDDKLAEAHVALANVRRNSWQWDEAQEQYQRAIDLNPNLLMAHSGYAQLLSFTGRHEQAIAEAKRARELDPLVPQVNSNLAQMLYFARRYEEAVEAAKRAIELDQKNQSFAYYTLGDVFYVKGMYREAIAAHLQGCEIPGYTVNDEIYLGAIHAKAGNLVKARASLEKLLRTKQYISPAELAILYAALGKPEQAFVLLEKAFAEHDLQLIYLGVDPYYDSLRSDPRFVDLLRRVGLPQ